MKEQRASLSGQLMEALGIYLKCGPTTDGEVFVRVECRCEFEPFGRASETWDPVWQVELCGIRRRWRSLRNGWLPCETQDNMVFKGETLEQALGDAVRFARELRAQGR